MYPINFCNQECYPRNKALSRLKCQLHRKASMHVCLQRFYFDETSKYRKTVVSSSNCDCVISVCTGKAECKQTERADEKQPSSYAYRFWFTRLLR